MNVENTNISTAPAIIHATTHKNTKNYGSTIHETKRPPPKTFPVSPPNDLFDIKKFVWDKGSMFH